MATAIEPGAVIDGKYRVIRRIGEGGMGTVYEGENTRIARRVAIKVLHEHVASSPEFAQRFEREARASARIGSPHVCDVLDLGDLSNGDRFIVMEFLDGESLEDRLLKGRLTAAQLAPIAFEILEGLGTMHQAGVVHRDLKPANVFLTRGPKKAEVVKILDFGVAKILPSAEEPSDMTSTGMMMGTPLYMSPEQARGARDVDGRTDIYAASVIFYRALTDELPHSGANLHELLFKIVLEEPRPIHELAPDVDEAFAAIVMKGLARDADDRYSSAREYQEEIARWGAAQGTASLQFAVTLSSEPPPLRASTGGFPASRVKAQPPITGPRVSSDNVGPPTPAVAKTQTETPSSKQSGGTPIVWSEDAPEIARSALAELEAKRQNEKERGTNAGKTQVLGPTPGSAHSEMTASDAPSTAAKARSQGKSRVAMAAGAAAVLAIAAIGLRFGAPSSSASPSLSPSPPGASAPVLAPVPPPVPAPVDPPVQGIETSPSAPTSAVTAADSAEPARDAPSAAPTPAAPTTVRVSPAAAPKVVKTVASTATAKPASSAATATATATAPATPTGTAPTKTRKFRTNLD